MNRLLCPSMPTSYITAIGTAVPPYTLTQREILKTMQQMLHTDNEQMHRLEVLYRATGIHTRHTVVSDYGKPPELFTWLPASLEPQDYPSVAERMQLYQKEALPLSLDAVRNLEVHLGHALPEITHLITVSCTGMYAPGLDIDLVHALKLSNNVQRTAINFMGCYAAFNGLKTADAICRSTPNAKVLVVCTELCSIHFQPKVSEDELLSAAIFSDGSAAALVESSPRHNGFSLEITKGYTDLFPEGNRDMAWYIGNQGFEMVLSNYVSQLLHKGIRHFMERMLTDTPWKVDSVDYWAIHPGGKQILKAVEDALSLLPTHNHWAYQILKEFGNMSSATVLFVLQAIMKQLHTTDHQKSILSMAFGPGLTVEALLYKVHAQC